MSTPRLSVPLRKNSTWSAVSELTTPAEIVSVPPTNSPSNGEKMATFLSSSVSVPELVTSTLVPNWLV